MIAPKYRYLDIPGGQIWSHTNTNTWTWTTLCKHCKPGTINPNPAYPGRTPGDHSGPVTTLCWTLCRPGNITWQTSSTSLSDRYNSSLNCCHRKTGGKNVWIKIFPQHGTGVWKLNQETGVLKKVRGRTFRISGGGAVGGVCILSYPCRLLWLLLLVRVTLV